MNGLDPEETRRTLERGQRVFTEVFGRASPNLPPTGLATGTRASGGRELPWGWSTSWAFSPSSHGRAEGFRWRPGPGTVVAGAGSGTSAMGSVGCFNPWILESLPWRFTPEIWSEVSGRRSSNSPRSFSRTGTNRARRQGCIGRGRLLIAGGLGEVVSRPETRNVEAAT